MRIAKTYIFCFFYNSAIFSEGRAVFSVHTLLPGKDYHLMAESSAEMHSWIDAIESARVGSGIACWWQLSDFHSVAFVGIFLFFFCMCTWCPVDGWALRSEAVPFLCFCDSAFQESSVCLSQEPIRCQSDPSEMCKKKAKASNNLPASTDLSAKCSEDVGGAPATAAGAAGGKVAENWSFFFRCLSHLQSWQGSVQPTLKACWFSAGLFLHFLSVLSFSSSLWGANLAKPQQPLKIYHSFYLWPTQIVPQVVLLSGLLERNSFSAWTYSCVYIYWSSSAADSAIVAASRLLFLSHLATLPRLFSVRKEHVCTACVTGSAGIYHQQPFLTVSLSSCQS